jgi:hypothetical protein
MKRFLAFLLSLILVLSLCGCGITEVQAPATEPSITTVPSETTEDLTAGAEAVLAEIAQYHSVSDDFDDIILTQVPDAFMLVDYRAACWTFFLVMSDGIEYQVIIDDTDHHITSISYWDPEQNTTGPNIYKDTE